MSKDDRAQGLASNIVSIQDYDSAQEMARSDLSYSEISAFEPSTFNIESFPHTIRHERELARYADWVRDPGNFQYFKPRQFLRNPSVQTDFTEDEAELLDWLGDQIVRMTEARSGRAIRPLYNHLAHMGMFRIINAIKELYGRESLEIFEIGPGTGYLGAMLIRQGHTYYSMDNAQAFYLYQNRLYQQIAQDDYSDWSHPLTAGYRKVTRVTHLPWWEYLRLADDCPFSADVVIANSNLGEMRRDALRFILRISDRMMAGSPLGLFLFSDIGKPAQQTFRGVNELFRQLGYRRACERSFYAFAPDAKLLPQGIAALDAQIPLYNPSHNRGLRTAGNIVYRPPQQEPLGISFVRVIEGWEPPVGHSKPAPEVTIYPNGFDLDSSITAPGSSVTAKGFIWVLRKLRRIARRIIKYI